MIYAGLSAEIAALEKLVHTGKFLPRDLVFVELTLPDDPALYEHKGAASLPAGWDSIPTRQLSQGPRDSLFLQKIILDHEHVHPGRIEHPQGVLDGMDDGLAHDVEARVQDERDAGQGMEDGN